MENSAYRFGRWGNLIIEFGIIFVVSLISYWIFVDPKVSIFKLYPQPWFVVFFWALLVSIWLAFNGELWPFHKLSQPWMGITSVLAIFAIAILVVWLICGLWGAHDPTFAWARKNQMGKVSTQLIVLIGFSMYGALVVGLQHYPWVDLGLKQPFVGIVEFLLGTVLTVLFYMILVYPNVAPWNKAQPIMSLPVVIGWYYACIEIWLFCGTTWENWPFTIFKTRGGMAAAVVVGTFGFGTILYWVVLWALKTFMIPLAAQKAIGPMMPVFVAQFLVWGSMWTIFWANVHPGETFPYQFSPAVNRILRFVIWLILTTATFYFYYFWFAGHILHEPAVGGGMYGNALGFADWFILINIFYIACFGKLGLAKKAS